VTSRADVLGKAPHWLLELDLGGRVFRFASRDVTVTRADGSTVAFHGGLTGLSVSRSASSIAVTVASSERVADWARLEAQGVDIASGRATLWRWFEDQNLNDAELVRTGRVDRPEYGPLPEPLTFSIAEIDWGDQTIVPSAEMVIDESTWDPAAPYEVEESALGAAYPIPIGYPGWQRLIGGVLLSHQPASPAYLVEYNEGTAFWFASKALIAGVTLDAETCILYDLSDDIYEQRQVKYTTDLRGRRVAYVDFQGTSVLRPYSGHAYAVAFLDHTGYGGGVKWRGEVLRRVGDVLVYLLTENLFATDKRVKARIDVGAQEAQRTYFNRWTIDCVIAEGADVLAWIRAHLMTILPMKEVQGPGGLYFAAWRYDATPADVVMTIDLDRGAELVGRVRDVGTVYNEFTLKYRKNATGDYIAQRVLTAEADADDTTLRGSYLCRISQEREAARTGVAGVRAKTATSDVIWDHATAALTLDVWAQRDAVPGLNGTIRGGLELEVLRRGDIVAINSDAMYWSDRLGIVEDITSDNSGVVLLDVLVLADPLRVRRSTS
jgi:hypothetical protein